MLWIGIPSSENLLRSQIRPEQFSDNMTNFSYVEFMSIFYSKQCFNYSPSFNQRKIALWIINMIQWWINSIFTDVLQENIKYYIYWQWLFIIYEKLVQLLKFGGLRRRRCCPNDNCKDIYMQKFMIHISPQFCWEKKYWNLLDRLLLHVTITPYLQVAVLGSTILCSSHIVNKNISPQTFPALKVFPYLILHELIKHNFTHLYFSHLYLVHL